MLDCMGIVVARPRILAPFVVGDFLIPHIAGEHVGEGRDDLFQRQRRANQRIGGTRLRFGAGQKTGGDTGDILACNERQHGIFATPGQPDCALRWQALTDERGDIFVEDGRANMYRADACPFEDLFR